jgi:hypothetical protein
MKMFLYSLACSFTATLMVLSAASESSREGSGVKRVKLVGMYVAKVGGKYKKLTLLARGKCSFMGTPGEWKVRNGKGVLVTEPNVLVKNGEVTVFLPSIRLKCYFRINADATLAAYAVTGFGGENKTTYKTPVIYKKG